MKAFLKWLSVSIGGLVLLCALFLYWLSNTQSGLRWIVSQVPEDILHLDSMTGDLHHFSFQGLTVASGDGALTIHVKRGELRFTLSELLRKKLSIRALKANQVSVIVATTDKKSAVDFQPWKGVHLPIDLSLKALMVDDIAFFEGVQLTGRITRVLGSASIADDILELSSLRVEQDKSFATLEGRVDLSASQDGKVSLRHSVYWLKDGLAQDKREESLQSPALSGTEKPSAHVFNDKVIKTSGVIQGRWKSLDVSQTVDSPWPVNIESNIKNILSHHIQWDAKITTQAQGDLPVFDQRVDFNGGEIVSQGSISPALGLQGVKTSLKGRVEAGNQEFSNWFFDVDALFDNNQLQVKRFSVNEKRHNTLSVENMASQQLTHFDMKGTVKNVSDFLRQPVVLSENAIGDVSLKGQWRNARWPLNSGSPDVQTNGEFVISGSSANYEIDTALTGNVKDAALNAEAQLLVNRKALLLQRLSVRSGKTKVDVSGSIGSNIQLDWQLDSPDISELVPVIRGDIISQGSLSGSRDKPSIKFDITSKQLGLAGYTAEAIVVDVDASLASTVEKISAQVSAENIQNNTSILISTASMNVDGVLTDHDIKARAELVNDAHLTLHASGGWHEQQWLGKVSSVKFSDPILALWELVDPLEMRVSSQTFDVAKGCLRNEKESSLSVPQLLCFQARKNDSEIHFDGQIEAFNVDNLNPLFSASGLALQGSLNGNFHYTEKPGSVAVLNSDIQSNNMSLFWSETVGGNIERKSLDIEQVSLQVAQQDSLVVDVFVDLPGSDVLSTNIHVDSVVGAVDFQQSAISGKVNLLIEHLEALPTSLLNELSLNGQLKADAFINGTLSSPELMATVDVRDASAKVSQLGLLLQDIQLRARTENQSRITVDGQVTSGNGLLNITGDVDLSSLQTPRIDIELRGKSVQLANTPELAVTGDMDVQLAIDKQLINLSGDVNIVDAELDFQVSETAVLASNDVVLLGVEDKKSIIKQQLDLTVDLGQKTHIQAQGLDAMLRGKVRVFQVPEGIIRAEGEIAIEQGKYMAYGQDLEINGGRLVFNGGSVDEPNIELRALKVVDSTTAGVSVGGSASSPRLSLFSSPSMPDQDILSFLVFGKAVSALGSQDLITLARIANSLRGDGQSNVTDITQGIQKRLGLTDFDLQFSDQAASITAGKQLSSKFYIGYGFGLLDATQSLFLRYKLNDAWSIKADVGADSGADLRYEIER